jgi:hypothetical protein
MAQSLQRSIHAAYGFHCDSYCQIKYNFYVSFTLLKLTKILGSLVKTVLFMILVLSLSLSHVNAQEQKIFQFELINHKDIPILGEKTKHEAALAKSINTIIKRWNANLDRLNDGDNRNIYSIPHIKQYNDALAECKIAKTQNVYYDCMRSKIKSTSLYWIAETMADKADRMNIDPIPTAKTSKICRQMLNDKFFLREADDYIAYKDNAVNSDTKHLILTKYHGTAGMHYFYHKSIDINANESIFSVRELYPYFDAVADEEIWIGIYRGTSPEAVKMFLWNDTIILSINNRDKSEYNIYVYDKESRFFDQSCKIERKITGYKNGEPICNRVINGEYKKIAPAPLNFFFDSEQIEQLNADLGIKNGTSNHWDESKKINRYGSTYFYGEDNNSYFADYRNEGKKHVLLNLDYSSGAERGCGYKFLVVYDPEERDKIRYINEKNDKYSFYPSVFSDCDVETKEEIISIDGKNYILVSGIAGLIGLYEIGASDNGEDAVSDICVFEPIYVYE